MTGGIRHGDIHGLPDLAVKLVDIDPGVELDGIDDDSTLYGARHSGRRHACGTRLKCPAVRRKCAAPGAHDIGLALQARIIIDADRIDPGGGGDPSLALLHHMPGLVRQMPFLPRSKVDLGPLRVSQGIELGRLARVVMDADIMQGQAGKRFDTGPQLGRQARATGHRMDYFPVPRRRVVGHYSKAALRRHGRAIVDHCRQPRQPGLRRRPRPALARVWLMPHLVFLRFSFLHDGLAASGNRTFDYISGAGPRKKRRPTRTISNFQGPGTLRHQFVFSRASLSPADYATCRHNNQQAAWLTVMT